VASPAQDQTVPRILPLLPHLLVLSTVLLCLCYSPPAWAQSTANYEPKSAAVDSVQSAGWDHFFPIWGKKVVAKGFELPLPFGLNVQYLYNYQELNIGNLQLGVNNGGLVDVSDVIDVGFSSVITNTVQFRPDLWVLPFLNVYGLFGAGTNLVDITLGQPVEFKTQVDRNALIYGFGCNLSGAISRYFVVVNGNLSWADVDGLDQRTLATTLSARIGRSFLLPKKMRIAGWIGVMSLGVENATSGSIRLGDVLPGLGDSLADYQNSDWYNDLSPVLQQKVDDLFAEIAARDPADTTIDYALDKALAGQWSVVFGGQYQFTPHWMFNWEYSHSETRGALLINLDYRFGGF
jgi:opacity protein-like surface antigen